jgi:hypothetical protein
MNSFFRRYLCLVTLRFSIAFFSNFTLNSLSVSIPVVQSDANPNSVIQAPMFDILDSDGKSNRFRNTGWL